VAYLSTWSRTSNLQSGSSLLTLSVIDIPASKKVRIIHTLTAPRSFGMSFHAPGAPTIWNNMPAANTELFSVASPQNELYVDLSATTSFLWFVNIVNISNSVAYLTMDYSTDQGATWIEMDSNARLFINSSLFQQSIGTVPAGAKSSVGVLLRVSGTGGGGIGDNPSFGTIGSMFY